jgi:thiol-disulfide isomerase/thioredoxin
MNRFVRSVMGMRRSIGLAGALTMIPLVLFGFSGCKQADEPGGAPTAARPVPTRDETPTVASRATEPSGPMAKLAEKTSEVVPPPEPAAAPTKRTAKQVLEGMVAAYKQASSYADRGKLRIEALQDGQKVEQTLDYSLVFVRPNKIRLQAFEGVVVCDGREMIGFANDLPGQVAKRPAPATIDIPTVFADRILGSAISQGPTQGFCWVPVSLLLMAAPDPLKTLLHRAAEPVLLEPAKIGDRECYRVQLARPDGVATLWIDQQSLILRRLAFPVEELMRMAGATKLENVSIVAEFEEPGLNEKVDESAFRHETPAGAQVSEWLLPPPLLMLGKSAPEFSFVGADGKPIDSKTIAGKIVVMDFWATWCGPCRVSLPLLDRVYKKYKDNPKILFLAVSVDNPRVDDKEVKATLDELNVTVPFARDPEQHAGKRFHVQGIPAMFVLGSDSVIQSSETGYKPTLEAELSRTLDRLLAGENVYRDQFGQFEAQRKEYAAWLEKWAEKGVFVGPNGEEQEVPEAKIGARTDPKAFALEPLWKCNELKSPGNLLTVSSANGPPKVLVLDSWKSVAEIGPDGKVAALHALDLPEREAATMIRTEVAADGKRFFAVSGVMQQQVHLFDENWKKILDFPEDALKNPHAGIADIQLADLDGDGKLELLVSYFGDVGVHCVSFEGKRIWANRSVAMVSRIALWSPEPKGPRMLLCTNSLGNLVKIDAQGKSQGEISVPNRLIHWVVSSDLAGDQRMQLSGLYLEELGLSVVIGIDPAGKELWKHTLSKGVHRRPVEQIVAGRLTPSGHGQWLVPEPDGSILVIADDGKLVDRWQTGAPITGLGTATMDGHPILVVASTDAVEAWRVK